MIEIFKTNIEEASAAETIIQLLRKQFLFVRINFDLSDCDRILRIEANEIIPEKIIDVVTGQGYQCRILD